MSRLTKAISLKNLTLIIISALLLLSSCSKKNTVAIAEQYGLAYAPLQIMRSMQFFEKLEPDTEIKWIRLGNTAAIREAVLAGEVDLGFMGLPPFLIGADNGMDWKLVSGLSICPVGLVAAENIPDFRSLSVENRIALPQPGSIQHILLSMAAEREFGGASLFDNSLITMKHPDGMAALLSGAVDAHFTSPPYIFIENADPGFHTILTGLEAFGGEFSFVGAMATDSFIKNSPAQLENFLLALQQSIDYINADPAGAADILAELYNLPRQQVLDYITRPEMKFTTELFGLQRFISFMKNNGYLSGGIDSKDLLYK